MGHSVYGRLAGQPEEQTSRFALQVVDDSTSTMVSLLDANPILRLKLAEQQACSLYIDGTAVVCRRKFLPSARGAKGLGAASSLQRHPAVAMVETAPVSGRANVI